MKKYVVFVAYSLKGNGYTEVPNRLKSTHKLVLILVVVEDGLVLDLIRLF